MLGFFGILVSSEIYLWTLSILTILENFERITSKPMPAIAYTIAAVCFGILFVLIWMALQVTFSKDQEEYPTDLVDDIPKSWWTSLKLEKAVRTSIVLIAEWMLFDMGSPLTRAIGFGIFVNVFAFVATGLSYAGPVYDWIKGLLFSFAGAFAGYSLICLLESTAKLEMMSTPITYASGWLFNMVAWSNLLWGFQRMT